MLVISDDYDDKNNNENFHFIGAMHSGGVTLISFNIILLQLTQFFVSFSYTDSFVIEVKNMSVLRT